MSSDEVCEHVDEYDSASIRKLVIEELQRHSSAFDFQAYVLVMVGFEIDNSHNVYITVPNTFVAQWYTADRCSFIKQVVQNSLNVVDVNVHVRTHRNGILSDSSSKNVSQPHISSLSNQSFQLPQQMTNSCDNASSHSPPGAIILNPKYRMDSFVVGDSNFFAHAITLAVAASPGDTYNPFFLHGGVGLGKTHLMQALGHMLIETKNLDPERVMTLTSEVFSNEYILAIGQKSVEQFRRKYRRAAVLLIDDVQFFGGKEKLQEEFFHTFNEMHQARRQIVMTSDRSPALLEHLQERLVSRFKSGVVADIKPPDLETKTAILNRLALQQGVRIDLECLTRLAELVQDNIRELEGAFTKVIALSSFMKVSITPSMIEEVLSDFAHTRRIKKLDSESIQRCVEEHFAIRHEELIGKRRTRNIVIPRQIAMYLCHDMTDETLQTIGKAFGGRDHTTVLHAFQKISQELERGGNIADDIRMLRIRLRELKQES